VIAYVNHGEVGERPAGHPPAANPEPSVAKRENALRGTLAMACVETGCRALRCVIGDEGTVRASAEAEDYALHRWVLCRQCQRCNARCEQDRRNLPRIRQGFARVRCAEQLRHTDPGPARQVHVQRHPRSDHGSGSWRHGTASLSGRRPWHGARVGEYQGCQEYAVPQVVVPWRVGTWSANAVRQSGSQGCGVDCRQRTFARTVSGLLRHDEEGVFRRSGIHGRHADPGAHRIAVRQSAGEVRDFRQGDQRYDCIAGRQVRSGRGYSDGGDGHLGRDRGIFRDHVANDTAGRDACGGVLPVERDRCVPDGEC